MMLICLSWLGLGDVITRWLVQSISHSRKVASTNYFSSSSFGQITPHLFYVIFHTTAFVLNCHIMHIQLHLKLPAGSICTDLPRHRCEKLNNVAGLCRSDFRQTKDVNDENINQLVCHRFNLVVRKCYLICRLYDFLRKVKSVK